MVKWLKKEIILSIILLSILLVSNISTSQTLSQSSQSYKTSTSDIVVESTKRDIGEIYFYKILLVYDSTSTPISLTALHTYFVIRYTYPNVERYPVSKFEDLMGIPHYEDSIIIYILNSTVDGVIVGDDLVKWSEFALYLSSYYTSEIILAIGNTYKLDNFKEPNWHYSEYEYTGLSSLEVYTTWTTAEILEAKGFDKNAEKLKAQSIKLMAENLNLIFEDNVNPRVRIGVKDKDRSSDALKAYLAAHPETLTISKVSRDGSDASDKPPLIHIIGLEPKDSATDFILSNIPLFSGIKGPAGDFLNYVLDFLIKHGAQALGLDLSFIQQILNIYSQVKDLIGDPSKLGEASPLKAFLKMIVKQIPAIANYSYLVDVIVDGFFALRGGVSDIINFLFSAAETFIPSNSTTLQKILNTAKNLLDVSTEINDVLNKITDQSMGAILKIVLTKLSNSSILALLQELFSSNPTLSSKITEIYNNITTIIGIGLEFLSVENVSHFADLLYDAVVNKLHLIKDQNITSAMDKIRNLIKLAFIVAKKGDLDFQKIFKLLITNFVPEEDINNIEEFVNKLVVEISKAIKEAQTDLNAFASTVQNLINTYIPQASAYINKGKGYIKDITVLLGAIANPNFDITTAKSLLELIESILNDYLANPTSTTLMNQGIELKGTMSRVQKIMTIIKTVILPYLGFSKNSKLFKVIQKAQTIDYSDPFNETVANILDLIEMVISEFDPSFDFSTIKNYVSLGANLLAGLLSVVGQAQSSKYPSILRTIVMVGGWALKEVFGVDISVGNITKFLEAVIPQAMGMTTTPNYQQALTMVYNALSGALSNSTIKDTITTILKVFMSIRSIYTNGIDWVITQVLSWIAGKVGDFVDDLLSQFESLVNNFAFFKLAGDMNIGIGGMDALNFAYNITFAANFDIDRNFLVNDIKSMIIGGKILDLINPIKTFKKLLKAISITPTLEASFKLKSLFSDDNQLMQKVIEMLGVSINIEGEARIKLLLFTFSAGVFNTSNFLNLVDWYLRFGVQVSKTFTLLDLFGAGSLNALASLIGLDAISIILTLGFALEIAKGTASAATGVITSLTLEISIAGTLHVGLDIVIASLTLDMTLAIIFRFITTISSPIDIKFTIDVTYNIKVEVEFLFVGDTYEWGGTIYHYEFPNPSDTADKFTGGFDQDSDGLADNFEKTNFGLSTDRVDTDGDGLGDNEELNGYGTDPVDPDTDGDGLSDSQELLQFHTNPFLPDTDNDRLTDYQEVILYSTNPLEVDTDGDGLDDYFEVNTVWDISGVTISITGVVIGGTTYYDHTDPLNPDTDGDGLLDGQEGPMGGYYGDALEAYGPNPIIFNQGYTHPLDNDTDDDSFVQLANGKIAQPKTFLMSMTDKDEIEGITTVFIEDGEPVLKTFRTSPVCPDTDQDTGSGAVFLNSDSYELSLNPPTDPLDGDTDDDGLIDGDEGVGSPTSNKTNPLLPDSDYDGLGDLQEILMGLDPRNPDTDYDMVSDGDEYLKYGTNPLMADSDHDNLLDGEELFFWHTNPMLKDSDQDGITDGDEVLIYFTNPMDEDTDNDNLTDMEEIFVHGTNPFKADSDYDAVIDGEEVYLYKTDPLNWDTDNDSILYPNEYGLYTWPMSDGEEIFVYGTNPILADTDGDGITDSYELYLASGLIPNFTLIPLDPNNNDTDGDGLLDGIELRVRILPDIIYPYISVNLTNPFQTSPTISDTDGDGLNDFLEVNNYTTFAYDNDTDNDNLTDYEEVMVYNTSPLNNDTDFDNISDYDEIFGPSPYLASNLGVKADSYYLDPNDPDVDNDYLTDGYEVYITNTNPKDSDSDNDGVPDGNEFDSDGDGLSDGLEFQLIVSVLKNDAPFNPDSDGDGLNDGDEVYIYGTDPANPDTDGDGFPDGAEVAAGTDPTEPTSEDEYNRVIGEKRAGYTIVLLTPQGEINDPFIDVRALNSTTIESMWFRFSKDGGEFSDNYTMVYDPVTQQWVNGNLTWEKGTYTIQLFGKTPKGKIYTYEAEFWIGVVKRGIDILSVAIGFVVGAAVVLFAIFVLPVLWRRYIKKEENEVKGE